MEGHRYQSTIQDVTFQRNDKQSQGCLEIGQRRARMMEEWMLGGRRVLVYKYDRDDRGFRRERLLYRGSRSWESESPGKYQY
jgi:hypothetical protein